MKTKTKHLAKLALLITIVICSAACKQPANQKSERKTGSDPIQANTIKKETETQIAPAGKDTIPTYTDAIYEQYIPSTVKALMQEKLPGWKLPSPSRWEKYWFHSFKNGRSLVDYVSGEFNGDSKPDYSLLLENEKGAFVVWVLQSNQNGYEAIELTELAEATLPLNVGLTLIEKGELNYLDVGAGEDDVKTMVLKHQAVQVSFFETAADTYYWKDGKYLSVTTGD